MELFIALVKVKKEITYGEFRNLFSEHVLKISCWNADYDDDGNLIKG